MSRRRAALTLALLLLAGCKSKDEGDDVAVDPICVSGCEQTLEADCPLGPASQEACETDCMALLEGDCAEAYETLLACAEDSPISCDESIGIPVVEDCPDEQSALVSCGQAM